MAGSGGTATGLSVGIKLSGLKCKLTGISVCDNAEYFHKHVNEELQTISPTLKSEEILNINDNYKGIGYGLTTKEELELMKDVSQTSGKRIRGELFNNLCRNNFGPNIHTKSSEGDCI